MVWCVRGFSVATLSRLVVELQLKDNATPGLKNLKKEAGGIGKFLRDALSVTAGMAFDKLISGVAGSIGDLVSAGLDFEQQMANVNSISQLTDAELKRLSDRVINLANDPRITDGPAALAEGLYQVQSSGFAGDDALKILTSSAMAATAGMTSTEVAAAAATAVLNAYGMGADQVDRVNNVMFQTVNDGVLSFEELARNMGSVLPVASALGVSIEELGAAYAQLTLQGMNASAAETSIQNLLKGAGNPTEKMTDLLTQNGYASAQAAIEAEGFAGFLKMIDTYAQGDQAVLFDLLGTQEAVNAALILGADGAAAYAKEVKRMERASQGVGATQRALKKQMESTRYQMALARKQFQVVGAVLMGMAAPAIGFVAEKVAGFARGLAVLLHYIDMVINGHSRLTKSLDLLPPGFRQSAKAIAMVVDAVGDLWRAFKKNGIQGVLDEWDRMQGSRILSGLQTLGQEAWDALSGAFGKAAQAGLTIASIAVDVVRWAVGKIPDLWSWLMGVLGVGKGDGGAFSGIPIVGKAVASQNRVTLANVVVDVVSWAVGKVADLWGWLMGVLGVGRGDAGAFSGVPIIGPAVASQNQVTLTDVLVGVASWASGKIADLVGFVQELVDKITGSIHWNNYTLTIDLPNDDKITIDFDALDKKIGEKFEQHGVDEAVARKSGKSYADKFWGFFSDGWGDMWTDLTNGGGLLGALGVGSKPQTFDPTGGTEHGFGMVEIDSTGFTDLVNAWVDGFFGEIFGDIASASGKALEWSVKIGNELIDKISAPFKGLWDKVTSAVISVFGISDGGVGWIPAVVAKVAGPDAWALFKAAFIGSSVAFFESNPFSGLKGDFEAAVQLAFAGFKLMLPSWDLVIPTPNVSFGGVLGLFGLGALTLVPAILGAIGVPSVSLPSWELSLPDPDILGLTGGLIEGAINFALESPDILGIAPELLSWALTLPTPGFPGLTATQVVGWIFDALIALGDINVPMPSWNLALPIPNFKRDNKITNDDLGSSARTYGNKANDLMSSFNRDMGGASGFAIPAPDWTAFDSAMKSATASAAAMQSSVGQSIQSLLMQTAIGFAMMQASATSATAGMVSAVSSQLGALPGQGYSVGVSLGQGIASGIMASVSAVASSAASVVRAAIDAAKREGAIASPSRKMMAIGGFMSDGLAIGLLGGIPGVSRAGSRVAAAAMVVPGGTAQSGMTGRGVVDQSTHFHIEGNVYGEEDFIRKITKAQTDARIEAKRIHRQGQGGSS